MIAVAPPSGPATNPLDRSYDIDFDSVLGYTVSALQIVHREGEATGYIRPGLDLDQRYDEPIARCKSDVAADLVPCGAGGAAVARTKTHADVFPGGVRVTVDNARLLSLCLAMGWDAEADALAAYLRAVWKTNGVVPVACDADAAPGFVRPWEPGEDDDGVPLDHTQSRAAVAMALSEHAALRKDALSNEAAIQIRSGLINGAMPSFRTPAGSPVYVAGDGRTARSPFPQADAPPGAANRGAQWQYQVVNLKQITTAMQRRMGDYWSFFGSSSVTLADVPPLPRPLGGFVLAESRSAIRAAAQIIERPAVSDEITDKADATIRGFRHVQAIADQLAGGFGLPGVAFGVRTPREARFAREVSWQELMPDASLSLLVQHGPMAVYDLVHFARATAPTFPDIRDVAMGTALTITDRYAKAITARGWPGWIG